MQAYAKPAKTLPRSIGHREEWIAACKGEGVPGVNYDVAGPMTETVLLGNIALRTGEKLRWDSQNLSITNVPDANQYIHRDYRDGWSL
jgi:hypothetical protein